MRPRCVNLGPQYNALYGQPLDYRSTGHTRMTDMINAIESLEVRRINEQTGTEYVVFRSNPPPAPRPITAGDHVEAKYNDRSKWRSAKVVKINGPPSSPTYDIMFCGFRDIAANRPAKNVRRQDDGRFYRNLGDLLQENPEGLDVVESIEGSDDSGVVEAYKLRFSSYIPITENEGVEDTLRRAERDGFCYLEIGSGLSSGESKKVFPFTWLKLSARWRVLVCTHAARTLCANARGLLVYVYVSQTLSLHSTPRAGARLVLS